MKLTLQEAMYIIVHEVELLQGRFDYKAFLSLQLAVEELERILVENEQIERVE